MSKPYILIIPGSFSLAEFYDSIVNPLAAKGYEIKAISLPTVGLKTGPKEEPLPTMYDDAAFIAKEVTRLADEGKHVILIPHSYGGVPTTESMKGLSVEERQKQGKKGGIIRIAYMTCLVPALGKSASEVLESISNEDQIQMRVDENGWMFQDNISQSAALCFSDIPQEEGELWAEKFGCHSSASFANELTYAGYKDVPVSYLLCEDDLVVPAKNQREEIALIEKESGNMVDVTSIKAGHCPNVSMPETVINWIALLAGLK